MPAHSNHFRPIGSKNGRAKTTEDDARLAKALLATKMPHKEIANKLEIPLDTVHKISQGRTWCHV
jgi:DNA invertase Pin-like site-specific DNA recombinase